MEIIIKRFKGIEDKKITFPLQITEIGGFGKTRMYDACMWLTNNYLPKKIEHLFNLNTPEIVDYVHVEGNFDKFSLKKTINKNTVTGKPETVEYFINKDKVKAKDYEIFCNEQKLYLCDLLFFNKLDNKERFDILSEIAKSRMSDFFKNFDLKNHQNRKDYLISDRNSLKKEIIRLEGIMKLELHKYEEISEDLQKYHNEYMLLKSADNKDIIEKMNADYNVKLKLKNDDILRKNKKKLDIEIEIERINKELKFFGEYEPYIFDFEKINKEIEDCEISIEALHFFENEEKFREFISKNIEMFPEIEDISLKISNIRHNLLEDEVNICPLIGRECDDYLLFNKEIRKEKEIEKLKNEASIIVKSNMLKYNKQYEEVKNILIDLISKKEEEENKVKKSLNEKEIYDLSKKNNIERINREISNLNNDLEIINKEIELLENEEIEEPILPERVVISDDLIAKNNEYERIFDENNNIIAANSRIEYEISEAKKQSLNFYSKINEITEEINVIDKEIKEYLTEIQKSLTIDTKYERFEFQLFRETETGSYISDFEIKSYGKRLSNSQNIIANIHINNMLQKFNCVLLPVFLDNAECCCKSFDEAISISLNYCEFNHPKFYKK